MIPIFSYKQYLDDMMRLKDQGHVDVDIQVARPTSAGSRGLARTKDFVKQPVHMMGENTLLDKPTPTIQDIAKNLTSPQSIF